MGFTMKTNLAAEPPKPKPCPLCGQTYGYCGTGCTNKGSPK